MKIILASSNKGKIREIKEYCDYEVVAFSEIVDPFEIVEDGSSFKENALIKARSIYKKIKEMESDFVVLSDDSGITVPILNNEPGIFSARYAGVGASDKENLYKLIDNIKAKGVKKTPAFYTAAMALITDGGNEFSVHGWMHGSVIDEARGENGFGYDPMFIPLGFDKTLGELEGGVKEEFSHRSMAIKLIKKIISTL